MCFDVISSGCTPHVLMHAFVMLCVVNFQEASAAALIIIHTCSQRTALHTCQPLTAMFAYSFIL